MKGKDNRLFFISSKDDTLGIKHCWGSNFSSSRERKGKTKQNKFTWAL